MKYLACLYDYKLLLDQTCFTQINILSYFVYNSRKLYWNAVKYVLGYIKKTLDYKTTYKIIENLNLIGFVGSNFARYKNTQ